MGLFRIFSSKSRNRREAAIAAGCETGLFQECPVCRDITERQASQTLLLETETLADRWVATGDERVAAFVGDAESLKREIRELKRKLPFNCTCENV